MLLYCVTLFCLAFISFIFFFNDTATTEIYTLSLHDALPISPARLPLVLHIHSEVRIPQRRDAGPEGLRKPRVVVVRSEEHTSELQSRQYLVCRLLLEKKKIIHYNTEIESYITQY